MPAKNNARTFTRQDPRCPEIFNNGKLKISLNHCDEVFITDIGSGAEIRMSSSPHGRLQFTAEGYDTVAPIITGNMIGWKVMPPNWKVTPRK